MVKPSLKLCADRATDGTVPFLGFANEDPTREGKIWMQLTNISSWN